MFSEQFRWITYLVDCINDLIETEKKSELTQFLNDRNIFTVICNENNKYSAIEVSVIVKGILLSMDLAVHSQYQSFLKRNVSNCLSNDN